jgi:hypothetical protein
MALFLNTQLSYMRKLLIIGFIAVHLFGNTELSQLIKLPKLISHFIQHHQQNPDLSFPEFIAMHYGGDDGTTADDNEDRKLPFHNSNCLSVSYTAYLNSAVPSDDFILLLNQEFTSRVHSGNPGKHVLIILQPPQII